MILFHFSMLGCILYFYCLYYSYYYYCSHCYIYYCSCLAHRPSSHTAPSPSSQADPCYLSLACNSIYTAVLARIAYQTIPNYFQSCCCRFSDTRPCSNCSCFLVVRTTIRSSQSSTHHFYMGLWMCYETTVPSIARGICRCSTHFGCDRLSPCSKLTLTIVGLLFLWAPRCLIRLFWSWEFSAWFCSSATSLGQVWH